MNGSTASVMGFAVVLLTGLALEVAGRGSSSPTAGQVLAAAMRTTPGRAAVLATWLWLGVHFLAR